MEERVGYCREDENERKKWENYECWVINIENDSKVLIGGFIASFHILGLLTWIA